MLPVLKPMILRAVAAFAACTPVVAAAADPPPFMQIVTDGKPPSAAETARQDILGLNVAMFGLYADAGRTFRRNILGQHPVILALFTGAGGSFTLYRPGQPPLQAPSVPVVYQLLKSVGHATMVLSVTAAPHVDKPQDTSWIAPLQAFRARLKAALDGLDASGMREDWRPATRTILEGNIAFIDEALARGVITYDALQGFGKKQGPELKKIIAWAAQTQVAHWMEVMTEWKKLLGADFDKTYAASNTIYVARQNNILFSVLAQFFGPQAVNDRLMLIETVSFTTTQEDMLDALTRIIADRRVGALFFGNNRLMDYELMGGDAREAIIAEAAKRGMTPFLPPAVPFGSNQWPALITPGPGPTNLHQLP